MRQIALIVEDDPATSHVIASTLATAGIESLIADSAASMWRKMSENPDVVILDLGLPDADGFELLRRLRQQSDVPVLIHSTRSEEIERIIGIEIGADDFLPKPCNMRELLARTRSLLRRAKGRASQNGSRPGCCFRFGDERRNGKRIKHSAYCPFGKLCFCRCRTKNYGNWSSKSYSKSLKTSWISIK